MLNHINLRSKKKIKKSKNNYLKKCFEIAFKIIKMENYHINLLNGPINKSNFLNKKYLGITEYISKKFK